jgi:hypothetical protein
MILNENMRKVICRIFKLKINPDLISPNMIADISYDLGIELTSKEIVYISDNFI